MGIFKETCMPAIFQNQAEKFGDKACVAYKSGGKYVDLSWTDMNRMIHELAYYLLSIGIKKISLSPGMAKIISMIKIPYGSIDM